MRSSQRWVRELFVIGKVEADEQADGGVGRGVGFFVAFRGLPFFFRVMRFLPAVRRIHRVRI
jgi:hypothetical protein